MRNKKFDAVRMMREIRAALSRLYMEDPDAEDRDLEAIRKKFGWEELKHSVKSKRSIESSKT